jgi:SPP1 gp7 family putative phage head morphogenesis protein
MASGWSVTADTDRFEEASSWFEERVPGVDTGAAADRARGRAFRIAGMVELDAVQTVFSELAKALDKGTSLAEFKARVREKLGAVGPKGAHLETVFRNWTQTAYNTGRYYQLSAPDVVRFRPYWMFDSILDGRTTTVCKACNGTIKLHSDAWWDSHWPPLHHRCRSSVRGLRASEAVRRGITETDPAGDVPGAWGKSPKVRGADDALKPKQEDHDAAVWAEFQRKQLLMEESLKAAEEAARRRRPDHWYDTEFAAKYGENAGRSVAWGRAMEERGRGVALDEAKRQHVQLTDDIGITLSTDKAFLFFKVGKAQRAGELPEKIANLGDLIDAFERDPAQWHREALEARALAALIGQRTSIESSKISFARPRVDNDAEGAEDVKPEAANEVAKAKKFFRALSDASIQHSDKSLGYVVTWSKQRAHFSKSERVVYTEARLGPDGKPREFGAPILVHEMMHGVEEYNPAALAAADAFLQRRTAGEPLEKLTDIHARRGEVAGYEAHEMAREDKFPNPYMGKEYRWMGKTQATEVSSMAAELLYRHAAQLLKNDPETFWFVLGQMAGKKAIP